MHLSVLPKRCLIDNKLSPLQCGFLFKNKMSQNYTLMYKKLKSQYCDFCS